MSNCITPFSLKDAPALIERLLPVQKLSVEAYKEQMAVHGKTLTALGSYWKGRKPLILNKACILGCLLPATEDPARDLEIFEKMRQFSSNLISSLANSPMRASVPKGYGFDSGYEGFPIQKTEFENGQATKRGELKSITRVSFSDADFSLGNAKKVDLPIPGARKK